MTPAQSDHGGAASPDSASGGPVCLSRESTNNDYDMDIDDDDFDVRSQPPDSPAFYSSSNNFLRPAKLQAALFNSEPAPSHGRLPTPIHATFKRGGMNGMGYPMSGSAGGLNNHNFNSNNAMLTLSSAPPPPSWKSRQTHQNQPDYSSSSRRMPSPISEDESLPSSSAAVTQSQLQLERLSFSHDYNMDIQEEDEGEEEEGEGAVRVPQQQPPITPRTRKRSGALTAGSSSVPAKFSMGYRADCEKCRLRVPGHYSHFL
ncbi:dna polymerase iii subunits gamma and tau [Pyrenophora seminiperda CCB06]|uniref:Dna polymerase iii subunits gamma and tau n=1 Tax=Pyrenophora seminiperda CCB06 TaxID=1302712 RepID=A0A3M7MDB9_9PLEO|nr:dna polymerase iii subunits gamma and tau [Pyrenophora seminiperda CCB06]